MNKVLAAIVGSGNIGTDLLAERQRVQEREPAGEPVGVG